MEVLTRAADTFVKSLDGWTQIWAASRDWFLEEWGRDTFVALPGILLVTGRHDEAKSVFRHFAQYMRHGLIPNRIRTGEMLFNTADGSMWYLQSLKKYLECTKDWNLIEELFPTITEIIEAQRIGTTYERNEQTFEIKMDDDGLICSPPQATWMDADPSGIGRENVTPRNGKDVEINALWYSNLPWVLKIDKKLKERSQRATVSMSEEDASLGDLRKLADQVKQSFNARFWNKRDSCLLDVVDGDVHGDAMRPNQILAVSHGEDLLTSKRQKQVLNAVTGDLLTPGGLRTLSPKDSRYRGTYDTNAQMSEKDYAYHQGTVWPWLMGPYGDAFMKINNDRAKLKRILTPLVRFALESEFKSLPEVFSGDSPHEPGGTTSQAWSVAELLRLIVEHWIVDT